MICEFVSAALWLDCVLQKENDPILNLMNNLLIKWKVNLKYKSTCKQKDDVNWDWVFEKKLYNRCFIESLLDYF